MTLRKGRGSWDKAGGGVKLHKGKTLSPIRNPTKVNPTKVNPPAVGRGSFRFARHYGDPCAAGR